MNRDELIQELKQNNMDEILELIEDAENGDLNELELARSLGLLRDDRLNEGVISLLEENGVTIIYLDDE
ncbi:hypothetical protein MM300_17545 [Evansella sp. LMS18]|jgi:hypothetical protein|uniref:hypothetical protein n=1 Tax=Evansella sp. LMS18 TaxID=2924033 RepID=UPI0020D0DD1F|nr:hypothetical protein [Evansella sp. LMS18]UTR09679.1 hypothetical protein MM300_17545 [Evansella sp. LMS18]